MTNSSKSNINNPISTDEYITQQLKRREQRAINLDHYETEIKAMLLSELSVHAIHGWFKQNQLAVSYSRLSKHIKAMKGNSKSPRKPDKLVSEQLDDKILTTALPSIHDEIE